MPPRSARKSRYGCRECKRRHVKCDENKPSCANCLIRQLRCSFAPILASNPHIPRSRATASIATTPSTVSADDRTIIPPSSPVNSVLPYELPGQPFQLHHLELFHHFEHQMCGFVSLDDTTGKKFMAVVTHQAIKIPYLMDQLLAFSAAHMCTQKPDQALFYRKEATRLQTRALGLFNVAKATVTTDEGLPAFLFSILLAHQILFDTLSIRTDFPVFLDKLVTSFHFYAGVRTIAGESWNSIMTQYHQQTGLELSRKWKLDKGSETIFAAELVHLSSRIRDTTTDLSVSIPCIEALDYLRNLLSVRDVPQSRSFRYINVFRWAVIVPPDFVRLIEQRRPEALIIITYYGVLIHNARDFWVFGDAGAFIIRSITRFLGSYWAEWLTWPNEVLHATNCANEFQYNRDTGT
ncbi:hypothetical protein F5Y14DRAFT_441951 [Nemania sp. NC0429]|nr:hypothetical protein F5Y14DRAFT_441951 [Nemania sp. NC0429]